MVGFLNWFIRFIPDYGALINPFLELIRSSPPYRLNYPHQESYQELKWHFLLDFKLYRPAFGQPFYLYLDTSNDWLSGYIFQQAEERRLEIITFYNFRLPNSVFMKANELKIYCALYTSLKQFRYLFTGQQIIVEHIVDQATARIHELMKSHAMLAK